MNFKPGYLVFAALNVRQQEVSPLLLMLGHAFFNGLGIALAFTVINVLLLENHGIQVLPYLYLIIAALLLVGGLVYVKVEHAVRPSKLFMAVIATCALWAIFIRFFLVIEESLLLVGFAFCTYYLIYLLLNLEFWGAASLLFDIRQGRRLFGPLSAGESVAKILGYAATPLIVTFASLPDALLLAGLSFLVSLLFLYLLNKREAALFQQGTHHHHHKERSLFKSLDLTRILHHLKIDGFSRSISLFAVFSTLIYFTIQYGFLAQVDKKVQGLEDIALFFGIFYSIAKTMNLIIKSFLSGRILNYFGIKYTLLLLPATLLLVNLAGIVGIFTVPIEAQFFIWIFSFNYLVDEAFRSSIYKPSYLTLFQPLARNKRLEAHSLSKGIMEPLGMGAAGVLILTLGTIGQFTLPTLLFCLLLFSSIWIIASLQVFKEYLRILSKVLKTRLLKRGIYQYSKEELQQLRDHKLNSKDLYEVVYAARMLEEHIQDQEWAEIVSRLIESDDKIILSETLAIIEQYHLTDFAPKVKTLIFSEDPALSTQAAYCYTALKEEESVQELLEHIDDTNSHRRMAIIGGILKHSGLYGAVSIGERFLQLITSADKTDRINAAHIIGQTGNAKYYHPLLLLLKDGAPEVRKAAIQASVHLENSKLINPILDQLSSRQLLGHCLRAIEAFGDQAIPFIRQRAMTADRKTLKSLIRLCSSINTPASHLFLLNYISSKDVLLRNISIKSLFKLKYQATADNKEEILTVLHQHIEVLKQLLRYCQECLNNKLLANALKNEVSAILLPQLLYLLSFIYDRNAVVRIIDNIKIATDDYRANALELLENLLKRKDARRLLPLIENIFALEATLKSKENTQLEEMVHSILAMPEGLISDWLTGICLRVCRVNKIEVVPAFLEKKQIESSQLLKEEVNLSTLLIRT